MNHRIGSRRRGRQLLYLDLAAGLVGAFLLLRGDHYQDDAQAHTLLETSNSNCTEFILPAATLRIAVEMLAALPANVLKYKWKCAAARIEVGAEQENGVPAFHVRDNGVGFDMKNADKGLG